MSKWGDTISIIYDIQPTQNKEYSQGYLYGVNVQLRDINIFQVIGTWNNTSL